MDDALERRRRHFERLAGATGGVSEEVAALAAEQADDDADSVAHPEVVETLRRTERILPRQKQTSEDRAARGAGLLGRQRATLAWDAADRASRKESFAAYGSDEYDTGDDEFRRVRVEVGSLHASDLFGARRTARRGPDDAA